MTIDSLFKKAKPTSTSKKKKSDIAEFDLPADIQENVNKWIEGKRKVAEGTAMIKSNEPDLVDFAFQQILSESLASKSVVKSVKLNGKTEKHEDREITPQIRVTQAAKFLKIDPDGIETIKQAFPQQFDDFFESKRTVSVDIERLEKNPELLARFEKILEQTFTKDENILTFQTTYSPTENFVTQIMTNKSVQKTWKELTNEGICNLQKPSVYEE
jgi:hypothetical protein